MTGHFLPPRQDIFCRAAMPPCRAVQALAGRTVKLLDLMMRADSADSSLRDVLPLAELISAALPVLL